jgi:hypothetical protein
MLLSVMPFEIVTVTHDRVDGYMVRTRGFTGSTGVAAVVPSQQLVVVVEHRVILVSELLT